MLRISTLVSTTVENRRQNEAVDFRKVPSYRNQPSPVFTQVPQKPERKLPSVCLPRALNTAGLMFIPTKHRTLKKDFT